MQQKADEVSRKIDNRKNCYMKRSQNVATAAIVLGNILHNFVAELYFFFAVR